MARVVEVDGPVAWLEPEQSGSCGGCAASGACGAKGIGTIANRLATRRFPIVDHPGFGVGEQVVVGVRPDALLKAAITAYAIPLVTLLLAGGLAQWAFGQRRHHLRRQRHWARPRHGVFPPGRRPAVCQGRHRPALPSPRHNGRDVPFTPLPQGTRSH